MNRLYHLKVAARRVLPASMHRALRLAAHPGDLAAFARFLGNDRLGLPAAERVRLLRRVVRAGLAIDCAHSHAEALSYVEAILSLPRGTPGVLVEAGCYKGGSTAKLSLAARLTGRTLVVFDSFAGIPDNDEPHERSIFGNPTRFRGGDFRGGLEEVRRNVARYGCIDVCRFVPGWFENTLPSFNEPVAAAFVDVDLVSSTRTCLVNLYPLLQPGSVLFSHDGHIPLVLDLLRDSRFWRDEVGPPPPRLAGLGRSKVVRIRKEAPAPVAQPH